MLKMILDPMGGILYVCVLALVKQKYIPLIARFV